MFVYFRSSTIGRTQFDAGVAVYNVNTEKLEFVQVFPTLRAYDYFRGPLISWSADSSKVAATLIHQELGNHVIVWESSTWTHDIIQFENQITSSIQLDSQGKNMSLILEYDRRVYPNANVRYIGMYSLENNTLQRISQNFTANDPSIARIVDWSEEVLAFTANVSLFYLDVSQQEININQQFQLIRELDGFADFISVNYDHTLIFPLNSFWESNTIWKIQDGDIHTQLEEKIFNGQNAKFSPVNNQLMTVASFESKVQEDFLYEIKIWDGDTGELLFNFGSDYSRSIQFVPLSIVLGMAILIVIFLRPKIWQREIDVNTTVERKVELYPDNDN